MCPSCSHAGDPWRTARGPLCPNCRRRASVTAGTIFQGTRKPLKLWFIAAWEIVAHKYGANAVNVKRMLGVNSYETAWSWLHKLRRAMVRPDRDRLLGVVEVDETYVGGPEVGTQGRHTQKRAVVAVAVEVDEKRLGRVRLRRVADVSGQTLRPFVQEAVEPGSSVLTDAWGGYTGLSGLGYDHMVINQSAAPDPPPTCSCPLCIASARCSNAGSWARTRERSAVSISTTTSTSLPSGSTGAALVRGGCCSTACWSRPRKRHIRQPTRSSWPPTEDLADGITPLHVVAGGVKRISPRELYT